MASKVAPVLLLFFAVAAHGSATAAAARSGVAGAGKCCALLDGLADTDAAVCLCTAVKADVLGINLRLPLDLRVVFDECQVNYPAGFTCT
uniref:Hydrophobic seed protein domain-containing protein n=1 Tax=Oryza brachyantha TaxID=4533 RepID=J3N4Q6_ORYBR